MDAGEARDRAYSVDSPPVRPHRLFASLYDAVTGPLDRAVLAPRRAALFNDLTGAVLEIGAGTGANLAHYRMAELVVAAEPDSAMRRRLAGKLDQLRSVPVELSDAAAEALPFPEGRFDSVVATGVLCTVRDPDRALAEVRRVLKPGGRLIVIEHVRGSGRHAQWQDLMTPLWSRLNAGCRPNRDTETAIRRGGFAVQHRETFDPMPRWSPTRPLLQAICTRP